MTKRTFIEYCLTFPSVYVDYPFDETTPVMRHSGNKKIFALIYDKDGNEFVNLKTKPDDADFFRQVYSGVTAGYHMNKRHWNSVDFNGDVDDETLYQFTHDSYNLTKPKVIKGKKHENT